MLARNMGVLYAGALPFALLLAGVFRRRALGARDQVPVTVGLALMLLYAVGGATPVFGLAFDLVPGVDFLRRPADALFLAGALAAIAAGYLMHRIWTGTFLSEGPPWGLRSSPSWRPSRPPSGWLTRRRRRRSPPGPCRCGPVARARPGAALGPAGTGPPQSARGPSSHGRGAGGGSRLEQRAE